MDSVQWRCTLLIQKAFGYKRGRIAAGLFVSAGNFWVMQ
ncbi:hypothetical protein FLA_1151 [Filimonas lacunae]|nr:hypothetical protein FLA_1151 [Filimonas lacunae]